MHVRMHMLRCMKSIAMKAGALERCLADLGISRDELARRMGVSTTTAYRVDKEKTEPGTKFIAALMDATGKDFDFFFEITEDVA